MRVYQSLFGHHIEKIKNKNKEEMRFGQKEK